MIYKFNSLADIPASQIHQVLHNWSDANCVRILKNIRKAMANSRDSRLLIRSRSFLINRLHTDVSQMNIYSIQLSLLPRLKAKWVVLISFDGIFLKSPQAPAPLLPNFGYGNAREFMMDVNVLTCLNGGQRTLEEYVSLG